MIEFKNGEICIWEGGEYYFVGMMPTDKRYCWISNKNGFGIVVLFGMLSKLISVEEKAAKDIYELYEECWDGVSLNKWDDVPPITKKVWIEMAR